MNEREQMISDIKRKYGLNSPAVFSAMLQVARERFVRSKFNGIAYQDAPVPIEHGQTMSQPYTVAFMTNLLGLKGNEKVLEVGTGSGYQAAVLSQLAKEVYTVEIIKDLAEKAEKKLKKLGYKNVKVRSGSGESGWNVNAPYDAILVTAGIEKDVPTALLDQLKDGGVLVAPIGIGPGKQMTKITKLKNGKTKRQKYGAFTFVPFVSESN